MMIDFKILKRILFVALPMIGALIAQVGIEVTDTFMMGQLGYEQLAGGGLGATIFIVLIMISVGCFTSVGVLMAMAKGDPEREERIFRAALQLAIFVAPLGLLAMQAVPFALMHAGQAPSLVAMVSDFIHGIVLGYPAVLIYLISREYLTAIERTSFIMVISIIGIPTNLLFNYAFMYGIAYIPAMGLKGVGFASCCVEWLCAIALCSYLYGTIGVRFNLFKKFEYEQIMELLRLGLPVSITMLLEVILFSTAGFLAGYLGTKALAIHQIALQLITVMIMVPIGFSQSAGVLISRAIQVEPQNLKKWVIYYATMVGVFSLFSATLFITIPSALVSIFIHEEVHPDLLHHGISLLEIAAFFQFFDALQVLFNGILRGFKDTFIPMAMNFFTYIILGVAMAYYCAFILDMGVEGIWLGLASGVTTTCFCLGVRIIYLLRSHAKQRVVLAS